MDDCWNYGRLSEFSVELKARKGPQNMLIACLEELKQKIFPGDMTNNFSFFNVCINQLFKDYVRKELSEIYIRKGLPENCFRANEESFKNCRMGICCVKTSAKWSNGTCLLWNNGDDNTGSEVSCHGVTDDSVSEYDCESDSN